MAGAALSQHRRPAPVGTVEAPGIAEAISAIDSIAPATGRLLILLVPVAAGACGPHAALPML